MLGFFSSNTTNNTKQPEPIPSTLTTNKKIKDYSFSTLDRIGKGFSSIVYKGINQVTSEVVAIKAIDMKGVKDAISREMLQCEIEALRTIRHENVLKCYDVVREYSHCYIVTEFCNQGDLSGLIKKKRKFTEEEALKYLRDIVEGFVEIGQKGFLHRDLKLANIFINDNRAKIADFGFAKKNKFSSEKQKYNVGSPLYMSPQALKKNIYSLKNDIWSIGIMAYEMLHGETPWQCKTEKQLIDKMTRVPVRFRDSLKISENTKQFIKKCLQVQQKQRMSLEDLKLWLNHKDFRSNQTYDLKILAPLSQNRQQNPTPKLNLTQKPLLENYNQSTTEATQRLSSRSQRQIINSNKQNIGGRPSSLAPIPRSTVQRNNGIVVNEINTFRLIFKILQKLRKNQNVQTQLLQVLGKQVIKRVTALKNCFENNLNQYGLGMIESYMNQRTNQGVKKYKSVVFEYYRKYTSEIKCDGSIGLTNVNQQIKKHLRKVAHALKDDDELLVGYWMVEFLSVSRQTSKERLDSIIDPKIKLTKAYLEQRIKDLN